MQPFERHELAELIADVPPGQRHLPDVDAIDWGVLDYLGWLHPTGRLGYVACRIDDVPVGLVLRRSRLTDRRRRMHMCAWCHTLRRGSQMAHFTRDVDGSDGRASFGVMLCGALDCSLRLRNLTGDPDLVMPETVDPGFRIRRLERALEAYIRRVRPWLGMESAWQGGRPR